MCIRDRAYSSDGYKFDGKCYDKLYNLQESQDNFYFPAGTGTKSAVTKVFDDYEIVLGSYEGPNETHAKLTFKSDDPANVIMEILDDAYKDVYKRQGYWFSLVCGGNSKDRGTVDELWIWSIQSRKGNI